MDQPAGTGFDYSKKPSNVGWAYFLPTGYIADLFRVGRKALPTLADIITNQHPVE